MIKRLLSAVLVVVMGTSVLVTVNAPVSANTDSEGRSTWAQVEQYCKSFIGGFKDPTCADYVSRVMADCSYYPGTFEQTPSAPTLRKQLQENGYQMVACNNTYRNSTGLDQKTAVYLGGWIAERAEPGDILIWVKTSTKNYETKGACHVTIYAGVKTNMKAYNGKTTWPAHYSDPGAGRTVVCQALWSFLNKGTTSGLGYGVYIYRRPEDPVNNVEQGHWEGDSFIDAAGTKMVSRWKEIDGSWYYFNSSGEKVTGLTKISGKTYYFNDDGVMQTGWVKVDGYWYLFANDGYYRTGWAKEEDDWYYMGPDGIMRTGYLTLNGKTYYLKPSGEMTVGWIYLDDCWYYYNSSGIRTLKLDDQDGNRLLVTMDGTPASGWQKIEGSWYYFNAQGTISKGWKKISGKWYYFDQDGVMQTGLLTLDGVNYYLTGSGAMVTGWQKIDENWYYLSGSGAMVTGKWAKINKKWYLFDEEGVMLTGFVEDQGRTYYLDGNGAMVTGWLKIEEEWYYLDRSGAMVADGSYAIGGRTYQFDAEGKWIP